MVDDDLPCTHGATGTHHKVAWHSYFYTSEELSAQRMGWDRKVDSRGGSWDPEFGHESLRLGYCRRMSRM